MTLFRLDSSIRTAGSASRDVADSLERAYTSRHPGGAVVRRDLAADPVPAEVWPDAAAAGHIPVEEHTPAQRDAAALAAGLADELLGTEAAVIAAPLYNFGVPHQLKAWIDLVITDPRFAPGTSPLAGRPVALVIARGGGYGAGTPREGWDHATPYLLRILGDVWGAEVTLIEVELTLAAVNPRTSGLVPLAEASYARAHERAEAVGAAYAGRLTSAA